MAIINQIHYTVSMLVYRVISMVLEEGVLKSRNSVVRMLMFYKYM